MTDKLLSQYKFSLYELVRMSPLRGYPLHKRIEIVSEIIHHEPKYWQAAQRDIMKDREAPIITPRESIYSGFAKTLTDDEGRNFFILAYSVSPHTNDEHKFLEFDTVEGLNNFLEYNNASAYVDEYLFSFGMKRFVPSDSIQAEIFEKRFSERNPTSEQSDSKLQVSERQLKSLKNSIYAGMNAFVEPNMFKSSLNYQQLVEDKSVFLQRRFSGYDLIKIYKHLMNRKSYISPYVTPDFRIKTFKFCLTDDNDIKNNTNYWGLLDAEFNKALGVHSTIEDFGKLQQVLMCHYLQKYPMVVTELEDPETNSTFFVLRVYKSGSADHHAFNEFDFDSVDSIPEFVKTIEKCDNVKIVFSGKTKPKDRSNVKWFHMDQECEIDNEPSEIYEYAKKLISFNIGSYSHTIINPTGIVRA